MYILPTLTSADVENGSDLVDVGGVVLTDINCRPGALIAIAGEAHFIVERISTTRLRIERDWAGDTADGLPCAIGAFTPEMANRTELAKQLRDYSARLELMDSRGHGLFYRTLGATGAADPGPGRISYVGASWQASAGLCIDVLDAAGVDATALIDQWALGDILLVQSITTGGYVAFSLSEPATNEGPDAWRKVLEYSYIGGAGALVDDEDVRLVLWRAGTPGAGFATDEEAATLEDLTAWDDEDPGFTVFVQDMGGADAGRAAVNRREGAAGNWVVVAWYTGPKGDQGDKGWSPQLATVLDGERVVLRLIGYVGGAGDAPTANVGQYLKADGTFTATIGDALDVRGASFNWRGGYSGATAYAKRDAVRDQGASWIALQATTGNAPPTLPTTSSAYWDLMVNPGANGAGTVADVIAGTGINVDSTDPTQPEVSIDETWLDAFVDDKLGEVDLSSLQDQLDEQRIAIMMMQLLQADILNVPSWIGPSGNFFADSFETLTFVDVAGATNLDTGTAGSLKPTTTAGSDQTATHTAATTGGNTVTASTEYVSGVSLNGWKAFDKVPGTPGANSWLTGSVATGWLKYQFGSAKTIASYTIQSTDSLPARAPAAWTLEGSNTGAFSGEQTTLDTRSAQGSWTANQVRSFDVASPASFSYYRLNVTANNGDAFLNIGEMTLRTATVINNLTVESKDYMASLAPTKMQVVMFVREEVAAVAGTDYSLKLTRDDAAYGSAVTLTELFSLILSDASVVRVVRTDVEDISGLASGTEPGWRFQTLTNKQAYPVGAVTYWS